MQIDILSLFPEMFAGPMQSSIIGKAQEKGIAKIDVTDFRRFAHNKHGHVDDYPYGGGAGMVLMCDPIFRCLDEIRTPKSHIIILSPEGSIYNEKKARELSKYEDIILICGHYEGFDERIKTLADEIISVGDFVLTGGEIPAMLIADSIIRLLPGAITNESLESESFNENLLDYPVYTKPAVYRDMNVPDILLSGDHKKIDDYRESERIRLTKEKRPDLLK